jgi:hypothetical protein
MLSDGSRDEHLMVVMKPSNINIEGTLPIMTSGAVELLVDQIPTLPIDPSSEQIVDKSATIDQKLLGSSSNNAEVLDPSKSLAKGETSAIPNND